MRVRQWACVLALLVSTFGETGSVDASAGCTCADDDAAATEVMSLTRELQRLTLQEYAIDDQIRRLREQVSLGTIDDSEKTELGGHSSHGQRKLMQIFDTGSTSRKTCSCASKCLDAYGTFIKSCAKCMAGDPTQSTYSSVSGNCKGGKCAGGGCEIDLFQCGMPR